MPSMEQQKGVKLWLVILSLNIGLFLTTLDGTIVATALVSIAAEFNNYEQSSWIVTAYLVTYSSFLMIFARLTDLAGRKPTLIAGLIVFILASLACALSRSSNELIIFRAFQGIGASGIYAPALVIAMEVCPPHLVAMLSASLSIVFAGASAVGPVIGGAITTSTTWRWCFWINLPAGALVLGLVTIIVPRDVFPEGHRRRQALSKIDSLGATLCLASSIMTIVPLQVGGVQYAWDSAAVICMFAVAGICWVALACWEIRLDRHSASSKVLALLPVHILRNRVISACICTLILTGVGFTATVVYLPQKFEVANDLPSSRAGVFMLPFVIVSALAGIVVGASMAKKNVAAPWTLFGNCLQLLGIGLMSSLHGSAITATPQFGFQVIAGFGFGCTMSSAFILARIEVAKADLAPTVGALTQLRILGGLIGVAFCRVVLFAHVSDALQGSVSGGHIQSILSSITNIDKLPQAQATLVRDVYGDGFALQNRILTYVAAVNVAVGLLTFRKHAKPLKEVEVSVPLQDQELRTMDSKTTPPPER